MEPDSNEIYVWYNNEVDPLGPPSVDFFTPSRDVFTNSIVQFDNRSTGNITSWKWTFEGGVPETSDQGNPAVRYSAPGSFDVQLVGANESESDTLFIEDYITVTERQIGDTPLVERDGVLRDFCAQFLRFRWRRDWRFQRTDRKAGLPECW